MKDRIGEKYGKLEIIGFDRKEIYTHSKRNYLIYYWFCKCECGNIKSISSNSLTSKNSVSCGCSKVIRMTTHGKTYTFEYKSWRYMMARCFSTKHKHYKRYGGRGITVCDKWLKFEGFFEDMGLKPGKEYSIDRINNDLGYYKENCRWATRKTQDNNKSDNVAVINTITGEEYSTINLAAEAINMKYNTLWNKLHNLRKNTTNLKIKKQ